MSKVIKKAFSKDILLGNLLGLKSKDPPKPEAAKEAPDPDTEEAARAKSRAEQRRKRSGRTSTVLTEGQKLG